MRNIHIKLKDYLKDYLKENINTNFTKWFGNSKVLDYIKKPLVVYHGTNNSFKSFDTETFNTNEKSGDYIGAGFYFTSNLYTAQKYGNVNMLEVYLKIEKPIIVNNYDDFEKYVIDIFGYDEYNLPQYYNLKKKNPLIIRQKFIDLGYDGLIDNTYNQYAVFFPNQIKSVENDGSFDIDDDNIYS